MSLADLIAHARISDAAREILTMLPYDGTGPHLAAYIGTSLRTAWRAVRELESEGLIVRTSTPGRSGGLRLVANGDIEANLRRLCHGLGRRHEAPPGQEYTKLADEEAARRDRARYCHATGTGPRWARELGAAMARGEA